MNTKRMGITVAIEATVDYEFRYSGPLTEDAVAEVIRTKYKSNLWAAYMDGFINDIDCEIVNEVLSGVENE